MTQILKNNVDVVALAQALDAGAVAVFATDTVYGIGTGAFCENAIKKICTIKNRPVTQPLQILVPNVARAEQIAQFTPDALRVAQTYWPGGLTLIVPPTPQGRPLLRGVVGLGIRIPACEPLCKVLAYMQHPLCSTSANVHGQPVLTDEASVLETFDGRVDYIWLGGTLSPTASSVLDVTTDPARLLREGGILRNDLQRVLDASIV